MAFLGDRPLGNDGSDRLGFEPLANRIATSLMDTASSGGLVVGIEGQWGSGKTSLIDLALRQLSAMDLQSKPVTRKFSPWLIGDRDALLSALFKELADAADSIALESGDAGPSTKSKAKEVAEKLKNFGSKLEGLGNAVALAGVAVPGLDTIGNGISAIAKLAKDTKTEQPLADTKDDLVKSLTELNRRIIVTIDDVDRLDPSEALEILRLVRSVGDFPNVIYLLSYDRAVLANSIREAARVQDGRAFLEKIVQASVRVPVPEEFRLRNWFEEELRTFATPKNDEEASRLTSVIMTDGDLWLKTPRAVVRLLDELRFYWPAIHLEGGDLADLVWLLLIKSGCPDLYEWVEKYCSIMSVMSLGIGRATDLEKARFLSDFVKISEARGLDDLHYRAHFAEHLLGVEPSYGKDEPLLAIFNAKGSNERDLAISKKRLKSPDHHRLYFALDLPSHSIRQADYDAFWAATDSVEPELERLLGLWADTQIAGKFTKCELLLERIAAAPIEQFPVGRAERILLAFGNCMDGLFVKTQSEDAFSPNFWRKTESLFATLRDQIPEPQRDQFFNELFEKAPALGWLSYLFRHDIFGHGIFGNESTQESEWLFSKQLFATVSDVMLKRYRSSSLSQMLAIPKAGNVFHTWRQAGDPDGPIGLIAAAIVKDVVLIDVLEALASLIGTSDGTYRVIRKTDIGDFVDFEVVQERVAKLAKTDGPNKKRAESLMAAFEAAKHF
jgi:hypothetical protein